ncbi:hypothetical protein [Mycobacteroides abscessus]|uniref:hypothetical protein n=1 Tax=Mycobacteroides abscessus TaxID=36809 RepID=UPI0009271969|nr:hypothetical protein [Mycobacteroides abscessus]SIE17714.1 Uncharacterised protein [Mycobacteroides abscessus subsp. abscessus]
MLTLTNSKTPWLKPVLILTLVWLVGAHISAISNVWVRMNLIVPAGKAHIITFSYAQPAVGVDGHTLLSLAGLLLVAAVIVTWFAMIERAGTVKPPPADEQTEM